ncbi:MAG: DUF2309 domain-containing protein [Planctomycetaceae bacterium]|jgi:uncharacterized protein YbcC (UPF0753/DUF2309 family)|nr:DUF2309 domain-containing protein [Planctomycetaceae bacterium]
MSTASVSSSEVSTLLPFPNAGEEDQAIELRELLQKVEETIAPVWPLKDFVAVNPFLGMTSRSFLKARRFLKLFSDCETLMPIDFYRSRLATGKLTSDDIQTALAELATDGNTTASQLTVQDILDVLNGNESTNSNATNPRPVELLSEIYDRHASTNWTSTFLDEVSRFCAAHYDTGQATWQSPWNQLSLYEAWRSGAELDRRVEVLGLSGFRAFVAKLPHTADAAIAELLTMLDVPHSQRESVLLCTAFAMPGWSAWARYQSIQAERQNSECDDFIGLLAIRLAYDAALSKSKSFLANWSSNASASDGREKTVPTAQTNDDSLIRYVLLRASEVAWRRGLVTQLAQQVVPVVMLEESGNGDTGKVDAVKAPQRMSVQMVFCIDVRSERLRRHLEASSSSIETFGFAGFFGVPIEFVPLGGEQGAGQVPALLTPQFKVREVVRGADDQSQARTLQSRSWLRSVRKAWKSFQTSATSCFSFVETAGLASGAKLLRKSAGSSGCCSTHRADGVSKHNHPLLAPSLDGLAEQGLDTDALAKMAASILRGIGITDNFARLVVFCGHGSETQNNPLQAGLDCGACGGHSGEPNARFTATLLNQPAVRESLIQHGILIPDDTWFLAALHNTTNDEITCFDVEELPTSHAADLAELIEHSSVASRRTRSERLPALNTTQSNDPFRRTGDWSETRPEWGLSGNAGFVVAPRALTKSINLDGRVFLHSYDHQRDHGFAVLEQIMTAPMVVAHWINMQYYGSTVDNVHFGSASKTIHNVVGQFGIYSGNGGDLTTGLPWQSLHDGTDYQHEPLRLLAVIAAPRSGIDDIVAKHALLEDLLSNDWLNLVAIDEGSFYRYSAIAGWQPISAAEIHATQLV